MKGKSKKSKNNGIPQNLKNVQPVKEEPTEDIILQFGENEVPLADISKKVRKSYKKSGNEAELKDVKIYVKPEENKAYYVVNGEASGSVELA